MLSFLPLSHAFERTVGYYLPMSTGTAVAYNRSIPTLAEDLVAVQPTLMISVPRIFERVYARIMDKLTGESALKRRLFHAAVDLGWAHFEHRQGRQIEIIGRLVEAQHVGRLQQEASQRQAVALAAREGRDRHR